MTPEVEPGRVLRLKPRIPKNPPPSALWKTGGGIYLGRTVAPPLDPQKPLEGNWRLPPVTDQPILSRWPMTGGSHLYAGEKHCILVAPNSQGKSRKILLVNLFFRLLGWSVVVLDIKGELCAHSAVWRKRAGSDIKIFDPYHVLEKSYPHLCEKYPDIFKSEPLNPCGSLFESEELIDDAKALALAVFPLGDTRDPYWIMSAQALAKGIFVMLATEYGPEAAICQLRNILGQKPERFADYIGEQIDAFGDREPAIKSSLARFSEYHPDNKEIASVIATAITHTDFMDSKSIREAMRGKAFPWASIKQRPTTVYLIVPPDRLAANSGGSVFLRLGLTTILLPLLRSVTGSQVPIMLMLDEFSSLQRMELFEANFHLLRGFGIKAFIATQSLKLLSDYYGEKWESFIDNAGPVMSMMAQSVFTRNYLSSYFGERTHVYHTKSWQDVFAAAGTTGSGASWAQFASSFSEQRITEPLIKPHELFALDRDEAILACQGRVHRAVCPQPQYLPEIAEALAEAERAIRGEPKP